MRPLLSICVGVFLLLAGSAPLRSADPAITAGSVAIPPSGGGLIGINFVSADQPVASLQFDIQYQPQAFDLTVSAGPAATDAGKSIYTSNPQPDVLRVLITGMNQTAVSDGAVAILAVQAKAGVSPGVYALAFGNTAASDAGGGAVNLPASGASVSIADSAAGPVIAAVTNAASWATGAVAPGEMVVIYGSGLGSASLTAMQLTPAGVVASLLAGTKVLFSGMEAPLVYTSADQVSAIVPYGLDGQNSTSVQVEHQGIRSPAFLVPVAGAFPGIFTADSSGRGQGAIVNEDGSVNTPANPAVSGSKVSIYGTGDGQTLPGGRDGIIIASAADLRYTVLPVIASIGGQAADVIYAGSAGGQVAGVFQADIRVPTGLRPGSYPVTLKVGTSTSQEGVTIAIQ